MAPSRKGRTYRVRQLPRHVARLSTIDLLLYVASDLGPRDNIIIYPLALNLDPWERPRTKVATVTIQPLPPRFDNEQDE